jgi:hypothetical protein
MTSNTRTKLDGRGFWRVEVRPVNFIAQRVSSLRLLQRAMEKSRVAFRGWDFPHIGDSWKLPENQKWIGLETDWRLHVELWRAFVSGQFVYRGGVWTDWLEQDLFPELRMHRQPELGLPIVSSLWSITEFFEFAARFSQTEAGDEGMFVSVSFNRMKGRQLFGDHTRRRWYSNYGPALSDTFTFSREISRSELIADSANLAVQCTNELFLLFGYEPEVGILQAIQAELVELRDT